MANKSVREMSARELKIHSLNGRMFRIVVVLAVAIGVVALTLCFGLYDNTLKREFMSRSCQIARGASYVSGQHNLDKVFNDTIEIYERLAPTDEERLDPAYLKNFSSVVTPIDYSSFHYALVNLESRYDARCVYICAYDKELRRMIYLIDADKNRSTHRDPGSFDVVTDKDQKEYDAYLYGNKISKLDELLGFTDTHKAYITNDDEYGYNCTGASKIKEKDRYILLAFADLDMGEAVKAIRLFFLQFFILLVVFTLVIAFIISRRLIRLVINPLEQLTKAADNYTRDRHDNNFEGNHFDKLDIRTGDEIENLCLTMKDMESDINEYINELTTATAEKERINTELDVARDIQSGMIPHSFPAYPDRNEFALHASMDPAKEVGGDFYDFFLIDDDHLALMIADVTGKGVPAALFMMSSKILLEMSIMKYPDSPAEVLRNVNKEICESNPADMFVTVWLGILEISSGKMKCANGGHEYPAIRREGGKFELFKDPHGTVLGCFEDATFPEYELKLNPGDVIFQYTDGATDTINTKEEFFGTNRLIDALNRNPDTIPQEILMEVKYSLEEYSEGAAQFDDLTMICLQYLTTNKFRALVRAEELEIEAKFENWEKVSNFIEKCLMDTDCTLKTCHNLLIAAEEIYTNICKFAYTPEVGKVTIKLSFYQEPNSVHITFMDHGIPFDPLKKEDPDVTLPAEERQIGGLGLYLVKKLMDDVTYRFSDNMNILTLIKRL
ncbi:MAG: SpoIIE family protein phosphatase [Mogibacterium sp.]|nr:SpoIIE family protein phosphatase [Mogibacterium sp.]